MRVKIIIPELADVTARLAERVDTGVRVTGGRVGGDGGVGGVGGGRGPAREGEDTADPEGGGTGARGRPSQGVALRGRVTGPIEVVAALTDRVGELDDVKNRESPVSSFFRSSNSDKIKQCD